MSFILILSIIGVAFLIIKSPTLSRSSKTGGAEESATLRDGNRAGLQIVKDVTQFYVSKNFPNSPIGFALMAETMPYPGPGSEFDRIEIKKLEEGTAIWSNRVLPAAIVQIDVVFINRIQGERPHRCFVVYGIDDAEFAMYRGFGGGACGETNDDVAGFRGLWRFEDLDVKSREAKETFIRQENTALNTLYESCQSDLKSLEECLLRNDKRPVTPLVTEERQYWSSEVRQSSIDANIRSGKVSDTLPTRIGACDQTVVSVIGHRLMVEREGSTIAFSDGGRLISYDNVPAVEHSRLGDPAKLCLATIPKNCPPGDDRGRTYQMTNLRTGESSTLSDSQHSCGGA